MLNVMICAFEAGIHSLEQSLPSEKPTIRYFISWQGDQISLENLPNWIGKRTDIKVSILSGKGLSRNRNNCIRMAKEEGAEGFFLIADEDVSFVEDFDETIKKGFENLPKADILCLQVNSGDINRPFKKYKPYQFQVSMKQIDEISSIEIAGKMSVFELIGFDERLGLGAPFPSGEETAFLGDCIRSGRKIFYFPKIIVNHPFETSGKSRSDQYSKEALHLIGGRAYRIYGPFLAYVFFLFSTLKNWSKYKSEQTPASYFHHLITGVNLFRQLKSG